MAKMSLGTQQEILAFTHGRDTALKNLDIEWGKKHLAKPDADEHTILVAMHKARLKAQGVPLSYKKESRQWLKSRGYRCHF